MELILATVTVAAAITITAFVGLFSTVRWERTGMGRSLMAVSLATALIAWMSVAGDVRIEHVACYPADTYDPLAP